MNYAFPSPMCSEVAKSPYSLNLSSSYLKIDVAQNSIEIASQLVSSAAYNYYCATTEPP